MRAVYGRRAVAANALRWSAYHARILDDASRPAAADVRAALRPRVALLAAALLVVHAALAIGAMWESSPTFDEVSHLPAGLAIVRTGEVRLNREHPPLVKELAGLAASTQRPRLPLDGEAYAGADQWRFGREATYGGGNDTMSVLRAGRLPVVALSLLAATVCFVWARQRFGDAAGLTALVLYAFSPLALAHGALVTTDAAAALGVAATMWLWWRATRGERQGWLAYALCGVALGAALAAKFSAVLLLPMMLACDLFANGARDGRRRLLGWLVVAAAALVVLDLAYLSLALLGSGIASPERLWRTMLRCFLLGGALEIAQLLFTEHRMAEWRDLGANVAGILTAWLISGQGRAGWGLRAMAWFNRNRAF